MKRTILLSFLFIACVSGQYREPVSEGASSFYVNIANKTMFDISILTEDRLIPSGTSRDIQLPIQRNQLSEGYQLTCYVSIAEDVLKAVQLENKIIKREEKRITIEPDDIHFVSNESFFVITNETNSAIRVRRTNSDTYRSGLGPGVNNEGTRIELRPGKTNVYLLDAFPCSIQNERNVLFAMPSKIRGEGFVNYFVFNGSTVTLTDVRPLHSAGEESWAQTTETAEPIQFVAAADNKGIHVFASTERGLLRNTYNSSGSVTNSSKSERVANFTFAGAAEGGFFIAGYERQANQNYRPIARIQNMDGATRCILAPSDKYGTARFFTAAQKDTTTLLLVGDGARSGTFGNTAYVRLVRVENDELKAVWERGGDDFKGNSTRIECGEIKSAVYNNVRDCWLVTGENITQNGSFIAEISGDGKISIDNSFKDMLFNKMLVDSDGACYLAGEEQIKNETNAVVIKYNVNDKRFARISKPPSSHSYYQDAIIDAANNRIVLGGVMKATDETGRGGIPFAEAIDIKTGSLLWREELSNQEIKGAGAVLVTAIAPAPDYGFALALSGITNGDYGKPFIIARVNSQGKFMRRVR